MNFELSDILQRGNDQVMADVDGEVVMMSVEHGEYYGLDAIGSHIWNLFEQPHSIDEVISKLMAEYEVDRETCEKDVTGLIEKLMEKNLLHKVSDAA